MDTRSDWEGNSRTVSVAGNGDETVGEESPKEQATGFNVMLRLSGGERIEAGSFAVESEAHGFAKELIGVAASGGVDWPRIDDRYVRPETIVSVDVERDEQPRWTGSTGRATSWTGRSSG